MFFIWSILVSMGASFVGAVVTACGCHTVGVYISVISFVTMCTAIIAGHVYARKN